MSIDAAPKLTKEEKEAKRARKEAKRAKKAEAAAAATSASASSAPTPVAEPASDEKAEKKKRKEEKKRKREAEAGEAAADTEASASADAAASGLVQPTPFNSSHDAYLTSQNVTLEPRLFPPFLSIPSLPVHPSIGSWLGKFKSPTPIQSCSWPALLGGRDVIAIAETGSGKTLGFGVPGLHLLSSLSASAAAPDEGLSKKQAKKAKKAAAAGGPVIQMLVLAPTRELALQSHETLNELGGALGIKSVCLYGGVGKADQLRDLARDGNRIVVGTPGRILDLADSGDMDLSS
jgi:ATP-dependent RNA helicase DBP3